MYQMQLLLQCDCYILQLLQFFNCISDTHTAWSFTLADEIAAAARSYKKRRIHSENSFTNADQHRSSECSSVADDNDRLSEGEC
jgi:hypothetical protein